MAGLLRRMKFLRYANAMMTGAHRFGFHSSKGKIRLVHFNGQVASFYIWIHGKGPWKNYHQMNVDTEKIGFVSHQSRELIWVWVGLRKTLGQLLRELGLNLVFVGIEFVNVQVYVS